MKAVVEDTQDIFSDHSMRGRFDPAEQDDAQTEPAEQAPEQDELRRMYREAFNAAEQSRLDAFRSEDYFHGPDQLSPAIRANLARRKQPPSYDNKIRPAIQGVLGLLDSADSTPEAVGREDADDNAATVVTQILRYLADKNDFDTVKQRTSFDMLVSGIGAAIIEADPHDGEAKVSPIPFCEFFYDPYSLRHDFLDAQYLGRAKWLDSKVVQRMFPDAYAALGNPFSGTFDGTGPEDQPELKGIWVDSSRRRVLVVELYYRDDKTGEWMHSTFCHAGVLDFGPSPYTDDEGQSACPIVAVSYELDRQGCRYGMVRDMIPLQDGINARTSKMLNITNTAQVEINDPNAMPTDRETARREAARPDGAMPFGWRRVPMQDVFEGNHILMQNDVASLERMAPSPALLGRAGGANESGRARQIQQQAGQSELARQFARWENWELRCFKQMWFRAQQFMTDQRRIRITNNAGAPEMLHINQAVMDVRPGPVADPQTGQPMIDPNTGHPALQMQHVQVGTQNELAKMDMDITLKVVRQSDTLRQEAIDAMLEFAAKTGMSPLSPEFELVIEMSPIPNKAWLLEKYKALRAQAAQEQAQAQAGQQQAAQQAQAITAAATQSKAQRDTAQAERDHALAEKHGVEADAAAFDLQVKQALVNHGLHPDQV